MLITCLLIHISVLSSCLPVLSSSSNYVSFLASLFLSCTKQDPPCPAMEVVWALLVWCCIVVQRCLRALSGNMFFFYQHYFWFSRSLQSLYWHKLIRFNQLQTHSADRALHLRYYDGSPSQPMFPGKHRILCKSPSLPQRAIILSFMVEI